MVVFCGEYVEHKRLDQATVKRLQTAHGQLARRPIVDGAVVQGVRRTWNGGEGVGVLTGPSGTYKH